MSNRIVLHNKVPAHISLPSRLPPAPPSVPEPLGQFLLHEIHILLREYREKRDEADRDERLVYSCIVADLEKLVSEAAHL